MSKWYTRYWTLMGVGLLSGGLGVGLVVAGASLGWSCMGGCDPWPAAIALGGAAFVLGGVVLFAWGVVQGILEWIRFSAWTKTGKLAATALAVVLIAGAAGVAACSWPEGPHIVASPSGNVTWLRQLFTPISAWVNDVDIAVGPSGVYVTTGEAFVHKYDHQGNEVWATPGYGRTRGIAVGPTGVYVTSARVVRNDTPNPFMAFVSKYDHQGNEVWTQELGTSVYDDALGIAVGPTGVYVVGDTEVALPGQTNAGHEDVIVRKYDPDGTEVWAFQFGTPYRDRARGIAVGPTGVYVAGATNGTLPGQTNAGGFDAFVRKYDHQGNEVWTRQFGTPHFDGAWSIAVGPTGVYVTGVSKGTLPGQTNAEDSDAFLRKYDHEGNEVWTRQFGTSKGDIARGIAVGPTGVYVVGDTFPGQAIAGDEDVLVRKYDPDGTEVWAFQFGTSVDDRAFGIAVGPTGVYVMGGGGLLGQDGFIAKIVAVEP